MRRYMRKHDGSFGVICDCHMESYVMDGYMMVMCRLMLVNDCEQFLIDGQ